jgi:xylulokinase
MSLLGIDVGTTGCKSVVFSIEGKILASSYREYDIITPSYGIAELESSTVWEQIKTTIKEATGGAGNDPVSAISVSSMGEATVPVTENREILGPSFTMLDLRGAEYLDAIPYFKTPQRLYEINGNTPGNHYGVTKLKWLKEHSPSVYEKTNKFLNWSGFVSFMLGAEPVVDYSLANRSLLFDINSGTWSDTLLTEAELDREKFPTPVESGTPIGKISKDIAGELGLPGDVEIITGAHDQCANAIGCGVIEPGQAMYGMGTFTTIVPIFTGRKDTAVMMAQGLNTEHHAVPDRFVSFIYNPGGAIVKWFRDTYAAAEHAEARKTGTDIYTKLFSEIPDNPGDENQLLVLPHFTTMGPPDFISNSCGVMTGLYLNTSRGDILRGILEGTTFSLKQSIDMLPEAGIDIESFTAVGGGSKSDLWVQMCADIMNKPYTRPVITEAGALGAAVLAGKGTGKFGSIAEGIGAMIQTGRTFEPNPENHKRYLPRYEKFSKLWPYMRDFISKSSPL